MFYKIDFQLKTAQLFRSSPFPQNMSLRNLLCNQMPVTAQMLLRSHIKPKQENSSVIQLQLPLHWNQEHL